MALFVRRTPTVVRPQEPTPFWAIQSLIRTPGGRNLLQDDVSERLQDPGDDLGLESAEQPGGPGTGTASKPAAASTDEDKNSSPQLLATVVAVLAFGLGLWAAVAAFATDDGPTYTAAEGIGAFALFYIAAQGAERLIELVLPLFEEVPGFGKAKKEVERDQKVAAASGEDPPQNASEAAANAQAEVDQRRANRTAVVFGFTAALGMMLCGYLEADFLTAVGVDFVASTSENPEWWEQILMMAVTGLVVGGGAKGLHDTISNISKSSEQRSTPPETGGQT